MPLNPEIVTPEDQQLVDLAVELVQQQRMYPDRHRIATVMMTESGDTFSGVCVQAEYVKPTGVCAERIALGQWATAACLSPVTRIASVRKPRLTEADQTIRVAASCGICREILTDYFPKAWMLALDQNGQLIKVQLNETLPLKYASVPRES